MSSCSGLWKRSCCWRLVRGFGSGSSVPGSDTDTEDRPGRRRGGKPPQRLRKEEHPSPIEYVDESPLLTFPPDGAVPRVTSRGGPLVVIGDERRREETGRDSARTKSLQREEESEAGEMCRFQAGTTLLQHQQNLLVLCRLKGELNVTTS
ncbi:unnamed protein product [Pleuronectes platessa]|uniref:Uncharacterized protein n=1 Tax=Pleuronectes platessa TaxID=8262 RepID=A0A9N7V7B8_PLEPL|nr:unnamed protein product [Pleuronectes platessa]